MSVEFCPECFAEISAATQRCPRCDFALRAQPLLGSYDERLISALRHPVTEVRMGAIIALEKRGTTAACDALCGIALTAPADLPQSTAVVECLASMLPTPTARDNLECIAAQHGARSVRENVRNLLAAYDASSGQEKKDRE